MLSATKFMMVNHAVQDQNKFFFAGGFAPLHPQWCCTPGPRMFLD